MANIFHDRLVLIKGMALFLWRDGAYGKKLGRAEVMLYLGSLVHILVHGLDAYWMSTMPVSVTQPHLFLPYIAHL